MSRGLNYEVTRRFEADARVIVPVEDEIGGTAIYFNGRLAYYVLNGEWIQAVPGSGGDELAECKSQSPGLQPSSGILPTGFVSTS